MDFSDSTEDAVFRHELREWLERTLDGFDPEPANPEDRLKWWRTWQEAVYDAGYAGIGWPSEHGGRGAGVLQQAIYSEECDRAGAPLRLNLMGEGLAGPTIIEHGSVLQKSRFLEPILRGEDLWCQLFSEPDAGSDLASLSTRAVRDGGGWRVTGRKVWTSNAHLAAYGLLLARTGEAPRHRGITYFIFPMREPGVTVHPLRQILGGSEFNEVVLEDVFVPDDLRIGPVDGGWSVAMSTLGYERSALATGRVNTRRVVEDLIALICESSDSVGESLGENSYVRDKVADLFGRVVLQRLTGQRILSGFASGRSLGTEASVAKLFTTPLVEDLADFGVTIRGLAGYEQPNADNASSSSWLRLSYQARGTSIAGGSTFIQRNIVAERGLGLPRG